MTTTFCVSGAVLVKAGVNVNAAVADGSVLIGTTSPVDTWINQAENTINANSRIDFISTYASLSNDKKLILEDTCSSLAAIYAINYDMSGYTSRIEAEDMVVILRDAALRGLGLLRDKKVSGEFVNVA